MMKAKKVLFITQEITPYVPESPMSVIGRRLPQAVQEKGREIRTFTPKWGIINERRNQLHEVIRLSGMNMIIDDTDHPLIIKVASIQSARMQVYFIDNDDYFHPRLMATDENGVEYDDNDERAIFYARGVLETVKKLRWCPDIIHCHGWMSALIPIYIKTAYRDEPSFRDSRVVYSMYEDGFHNSLKENFTNQLLIKDMTAEQLAGINTPVDATELNRLAIKYSDGLIQNSPDVHPELMEYAQELGVATLPYQGEENYVESFCNFYDQVWSVGKVEEEEEED
ncbi:MAG: glycogen/starch synthase [Bacteroidaceae bacterium]|nr:glycogen/starch synthase [Bacteroidaceae bacterium]